MKHAIVAIEDKRFYEHRGVDVRGMARALWADVSNRGTVQGGSTITQQFVKNAYLTSQQTVGRKLIEAALAWQLEQKWSKDRILTAYLNTVYFGNGAYGVEQASRIYFHHRAAQMKPAEAALLAGIPEDPSLWDPVAHPQAAKARRNLVLKQLYLQHYLTTSQYVNSLVYPMPDPAKVTLPSTQGVAAPYFANYVKDQLVHTLGPRRTFGGGLRVTTTLDVDLQQAAREAIKSVLPTSSGPTAALVALDAQTGAVLAMVGGENYHQNQFNLATQGERQPGSAFKPFVLATALRENISPSSTLTSSKQVTINAGGRLWTVNNYEGEALGPIDLTKAIAVSDNSVFSQLTALVGPQKVAQTARDLGITTPLQGYFAIGLGAEPATPLEMARAYASFADGGKRIDGSIFGNAPRAVEEIKTGSKRRRQPPGRTGRSSARRRPTWSTSCCRASSSPAPARRPRSRDAQVAGKTGTTENYGDAWFVGYTPQFVVAVWVGYPNKLVPMLTEFHGHAVAGGTFPALIWKAFMQKALALKHVPPESFEAPASLVRGAGAGRQPRRPSRARQRRLQELVHPRVLRRRGAGAHRHLQAERGRDPRRRRADASQAAKTRLDGQPLTAAVVYKPARTGERLGYVVGQFPRRGTASAYDKITLVLAKSLHGVVPRVVGLKLPQAERKLARLHLKVRTKGPRRRTVVRQSLPPRTASAPGPHDRAHPEAGNGRLTKREPARP